MTVEQRLSKMEYFVRNFQIVVVGDAIVVGGFGDLPKSDGVEDRINNLERSINRFSLAGDNVLEVSGSLEEGYVIQ